MQAWVPPRKISYFHFFTLKIFFLKVKKIESWTGHSDCFSPRNIPFQQKMYRKTNIHLYGIFDSTKPERQSNNLQYQLLATYSINCLMATMISFTVKPVR